MSAAAPDPGALVVALRRARRSALVVLGLCALAAGYLALSEGEPGPVDRRYTAAAIALAALSILSRRSVSGSAWSARLLLLQRVSCAAAALLGVLGLALALRTGQASVGLLYCVAGALLLLRPAPRLLPERAPTPRRD